MEPEFAAALAAFTEGPDSTHAPDIASTRSFFEKAFIVPITDFLEPDLPSNGLYTVHEQIVPVDGGAISVRCVVPADDEKPRTYPVLVNIHGGGWSVGSKDVDDCTLRHLCVNLGLTTVNVGYRLAPENPFPTAVDDCLAALKWLLREPMVCHPDAYPEEWKSGFRSMEKNKDMPPVTRALLHQFFGWYAAPAADPRFSPLLYPSHAGLPRAYIQAMELDPLRHDALVYARALRHAGVAVRLDLYPGVSHGFHYVWPHLKASAKVRSDLVEGVQWLLSQENTSNTFRRVQMAQYGSKW